MQLFLKRQKVQVISGLRRLDNRNDTGMIKGFSIEQAGEKFLYDTA